MKREASDIIHTKEEGLGHHPPLPEEAGLGQNLTNLRREAWDIIHTNLSKEAGYTITTNLSREPETHYTPI